MVGTILSIIIFAILCPVLFFVGVCGISGAPGLTPLRKYLPAGIIYAGAASGVTAIILLVKLIVGLF